MTKLTTEELQGLLEKATPGPWAVKYNRRCTFLQTPEGDTMCDEPYYPWVPGNDADWHLIAAAPDLAKDRIRLEAENAALRAEVEKLRKAVAVAASYIETFIEDGCPVCGGDCSSSAVLPGYCPMESANRDLIAARAALGEGGE